MTPSHSSISALRRPRSLANSRRRRVVGPPQNVAIAPDESIVLVSANMKLDPADPKKLVPDNRLTVLDLKGNPPAVIATLETGLGPAGISINRAGTLALVANRNDGTVSIFTISANSDRPRKDRSWQIRNPARAASHFRSGRGPSPRTGKRISDARDEGPQSASGRSSFPAATANGPLHPPQTAENRGCSAETGNSGLAQDCVVGLGDGVSGLVAAVSGPLGDCASD